MDLFRDVRAGIFTELSAAVPVVDPYRRNLQRAFVQEMNGLINPPARPATPPFPGAPAPPQVPGDATAQARVELQGITASIRTALPRVTDRATRAHLVDLQARIEKVFNPN